MGLVYRRRILTSRSRWTNVSGSGLSESARIGRLTVNTRGQGRIRLLPGLSFRFRIGGKR